MTKLINLILFLASIIPASSALECPMGWVAYTDEYCIRFLPSRLNYQDARQYCASQDHSKILTVKSAEMQAILVNNTRLVDFYPFWLGGRYDNRTKEFLWEDGEPLKYTNWQEGYPVNTSLGSETCIETRPTTMTGNSGLGKKWIDGDCRKRIYVICQRSWTVTDAITQITRLTKHFQDNLNIVNSKLDNISRERDELREQLEITKASLEAVSSRVVPVGSIYIEYSSQASPRNLWPTLTWSDISSTYAGLFFRAYGGGSANWGQTQIECAPRIDQMGYEDKWHNESGYSNPLGIPSSGWSQYGVGGLVDWNSGGRLKSEGIRFHTHDCEVRPKNQAIKVWKRVA